MAMQLRLVIARVISAWLMQEDGGMDGHWKGLSRIII